MQFYRYTILLLVTFYSLSITAQQGLYNRARINLDNTHTIRDLGLLGIDLEHGEYRNGVSITSDFSQEELNRVAAAGFSYTVLINDVASFYANRAASSVSLNNQRAVQACSGTIAHTVPSVANFTTGSMGGYYTLQQVWDVMDSMHAKFPNLISAKADIDTFHSIEGRPIYWMRVSNFPDSNQSTKPQLLLTALHHAREPATITNVFYYVWYLLENYNTDPYVKYLLDNTELYVVPLVNPDGYYYNQTTNPNGGGMWRKNRRHNSDGTYGVDINRNYGYNWGYDNVGSSNVTSDDTYRGPSAFSEPETRAMKYFAEHHNFKICLNYHTYGNDISYPWGYIGTYKTPDSTVYDTYGSIMTQYNHYPYGTGDQTVGYVTNGDADDWNYGEQNTKNKILSMTPETGSNSQGFWPASTDILGIAQDNFDMMFFAHKFLLKLLVVNNVTPKVTVQHSFWFKYNAERIGLDSTGTYTVSLVSNDPNVTVPASVNTLVQPSLFNTYTDSFFVQLNPALNASTDFSFIVHISNGINAYEDTITMKFISGDTLFNSNCNSVTPFTTTSTWGATTSTYVSATGSITDSPNSNYHNNANTLITLTNAIDLTTVPVATLLYNAKWQLEKDYDYVVPQISTNGGTSWTSLCGMYTNVGTNQNNSTDNLYDGYQADWVQEVVDLTPYVGNNIKLRFQLVSDQYQTYDGFYFDDLTVLGPDTTHFTTNIPNKVPSDNWQVFPNPANNSISFHPAMDGREVVVYDVVGNIVLKQTISGNTINVSGFSPGLYFVSVNEKTEFSGLKKLVIEK